MKPDEGTPRDDERDAFHEAMRHDLQLADYLEHPEVVAYLERRRRLLGQRWPTRHAEAQAKAAEEEGQ